MAHSGCAALAVPALQEIRQSCCRVTSSGCVSDPKVKHMLRNLFESPDHQLSTNYRTRSQHLVEQPLHSIIMAEAVVLLGAIASSSQLAEQLIKACRRIYKAYRLIDDDSLSLRKHLVHLEQLKGIARLIIQNPGLQRDSVASVLTTCLSEVEEMQRLLDECTTTKKNRPKEKIQKAFNAAANAKKVEALFQRLERQERFLALCIQEGNSYVARGSLIVFAYINLPMKECPFLDR